MLVTSPLASPLMMKQKRPCAWLDYLFTGTVNVRYTDVSGNRVSDNSGASRVNVDNLHMKQSFVQWASEYPTTVTVLMNPGVWYSNG